MTKTKNFLLAVAWCWVSAFISMLIMADSGSFVFAELPVYFDMATWGVFLGPLFIGPGLLGNGTPLVFPVSLIAYIVYIALLWMSVCSKNPWTRYICLSIITIGAFIGWQGLRNSI